MESLWFGAGLHWDYDSGEKSSPLRYFSVKIHVWCSFLLTAVIDKSSTKWNGA